MSCSPWRRRPATQLGCVLKFMEAAESSEERRDGSGRGVAIAFLLRPLSHLDFMAASCLHSDRIRSRQIDQK